MRILFLFWGLIFLDINSCFSSPKVVPVDITKEDVTGFIEILDKEESVKEAMKITSLVSLVQKVEELINGGMEDYQEIKSILELKIDQLGETSEIVQKERDRLTTSTENYVQKNVFLNKNNNKISLTDITIVGKKDISEKILSTKSVEKTEKEVSIEEYREVAKLLKTEADKSYAVSSSGFHSMLIKLALGKDLVEKTQVSVRKISDITKNILEKINPKNPKKENEILVITSNMTSEKSELGKKKEKIEEISKGFSSGNPGKGKLEAIIGGI